MRPVDLKTVVKVLGREGFFFVSQRGSHAKFRKFGSPVKTVIVKMTKKQIPHGTFQSILLQPGLEESDFREAKK